MIAAGVWIVLLIAYITFNTFSPRGCSCPGTEKKRTSFVPEHIAVRSDEEDEQLWEQYPTFVPPDIFDNITILQNTVNNMGLMHRSTGVAVNGKYMTWVDSLGNERPLYPRLVSNDAEGYVVAGLHQMHCFAEMLLDFGYLTNGYKPQWERAHAIHCFNLFYRAITCLADATVESLTSPQGSKPIGEIAHVLERYNQPKCRDFNALQRWADDPKNALPFEYLSGHVPIVPEKFCPVKD